MLEKYKKQHNNITKENSRRVRLAGGESYRDKIETEINAFDMRITLREIEQATLADFDYLCRGEPHINDDPDYLDARKLEELCTVPTGKKQQDLEELQRGQWQKDTELLEHQDQEVRLPREPEQPKIQEQELNQHQTNSKKQQHRTLKKHEKQRLKLVKESENQQKRIRKQMWEQFDLEEKLQKKQARIQNMQVRVQNKRYELARRRRRVEEELERKLQELWLKQLRKREKQRLKHLEHQRMQQRKQQKQQLKLQQKQQKESRKQQKQLVKSA